MKPFDYNGTGQPLHFLHANGYPPECYKPLFELLKTEYRVFGMCLRPLWEGSKPHEIRTWHPLSDDLLRFLSEHEAGPVIGVGHSVGAVVTLRAALREPGRFRALVLIDPVLFVPARLAAWSIIRTLGLGERLHPLIRSAQKRRRAFDDLETVFRGYRSRPIFRYMSDENLRAYIAGITKPSANGRHELVYSPEWEAQIYRTGLHDFDIWRSLPKLETPTIILRGAETDTFLENAARLVRKKQPKVRIEALEKSTHLLPLERPKEVFDIMQSFLKEVL
ncbi:MAG: alpha/beta fold hydrolase [Chloroflexota bacterium]|nr:alpha/beta hydrolase [Chloroflexota bacterium]MBI5704028.1 alpha/beta hydrolase [Chloroflexota bacterium]